VHHYLRRLEAALPKIDIYTAYMKKTGTLEVAATEALGPLQAAAILTAFLADLPAERVAVVHLSGNGGVLGIELVAAGGGSTCSVTLAECFRGAIAHGARGIIIGHNHPSGDPTPSPEDLELTKHMIEAGKLLGIAVVDHIIVTRKRWTSIFDVAPRIDDEAARSLILILGHAGNA
jgi:DNA repair protein RadC